jgi:SAM-dependent methyltransferase
MLDTRDPNLDPPAGLHEWLFGQVLDLPEVSRDSRVIDLGCGPGQWLKLLHAGGFRDLTGIDRRPDYFTAHGLAKFIEADLTVPLDSLSGQFDLVTAIEVVEHVSNPEAVFAAAASCLAQSGWLVMTTPNIYSIRARTRFLLKGTMPYFDHSANPEHIHPLLLDAIVRTILPRHRLTLQRVCSFPEQGSNGSRWFVRLGQRLLGYTLPDPLPGDHLCLFLRRTS